MVLPPVVRPKTLDFLENFSTARRLLPARYKQTTFVGQLLTTPGEQTTADVASTVADDRRLFIALGVQLCVERDDRLGVSEAASRVSIGVS